MGFLKGLGTTVCSFLLFLALWIFSVAFMLHSTVLSTAFLDRQINNLNISSIARDVVDNQLSIDFPANSDVLKEVALNVLAKQEPWIKTQLTTSVNTAHDFFTGKTKPFSITIPFSDMKATLNQDMWDAAKSYLQQQLQGKSDYEVSQYLQDFITEFPPDILPPELYMLPANTRDQAIEQFLRDFTGEPLLPNVDPNITALAQSNIVRNYFDDYISQFTSQIPNTKVFDESSMNSNTVDTLYNIRKYVGYFQTAYPWLIVFMVVMAGLIFLINRNVKSTTRTLGTSLITFGIPGLVGIIIARVVNIPQMITDHISGVTTAEMSIVDSIYKDVMNITMSFVIGVLAAGIVLLVVSFFFKSRPKEAA